MPRPLIVICCVGLTPAHIGADTPNLRRLADRGFMAPMAGIVPAVTTSAQATIVTGTLPRQHGIVGNGWYFRELGEVWFWRQSQRLIEAESFWSRARRTRPVSVLKHFWWYAMNSDVDAVVTPRPAYHHDGSKSPDIYTLPATLKDRLNAAHGEFPLFTFWGPAAAIDATRWIADGFATSYRTVAPDVSLVYLPHLDYDLQRFGPTGAHLAGNLRALDTEVGKVIGFAGEAAIAVVSEYGIGRVDTPVFINRRLRELGSLAVTTNATGELLDPGASAAFAVCDHQIAHVYCRDGATAARTAAALATLPGIERVYAGGQRREIGLDHGRSGEVIAVAAPGAWFTYDYWLDDSRRPDFARAVEIHKKPGYDPRELFFDPKGGKLRAMRALMRKKLGLRYVMDPVPLDASLVRGSHGRPPSAPEHGPVLIASERGWQRDQWSMLDLAALFEQHLLGG
ncbi:MAG TPA: nucleotide pyrophosphatase/phosphodiesterase family protein [Planctomycetota bacterium]|nr:nucleotide pyrophosphatase/phosphodiesterase family protein [Planctomycetota bacterium]